MSKDRDPIMLFMEHDRNSDSFAFKNTVEKAVDLYCENYDPQYKNFLVNCLQGIENLRQAALFVKKTAGTDTTVVVRYVNRSLVAHVSEILNSYFRLTELLKSLVGTTGKFTPETAKEIAQGYAIRNQTLKTELDELEKELSQLGLVKK